MASSRIQRRMEEKSKHTIIFSLIGSVVVLFLLFTYGIPLFTNYVLFLGKNKNDLKANTVDHQISYIAPPILADTFTATNSANVTIKGTANKGQKVKLFINGNVAGQKESDDKGKFVFDSVTLKEGDNDITAKAYSNDGKESGYSNSLTITYKNKGPNLTVDSPSDNATYSGSNSQTIYVTGSTDPDSKVTVNTFWAITDSQGKYNYRLQLQNGGNDIKIIATDPAGNATTIERHVTFNP